MPVVMTVDINQVKNALQTITQSAEIMPQVLKAELNVVTKQRISLLKANTPIGSRVDPRYPKKLINSYHWRTKGDTREIYIDPASSVKKFNYVTQGTMPHKILPSSKQALWWLNISGNHPVAVVNHPGTRANPYHERAEAQYNSSGFQDRLDQMMTDKYTEIMCKSINTANTGGGNTLGALGTSVLGFNTLLAALNNME